MKKSRSQKIKEQRWNILLSGLLDNGDFNNWILQIRKFLEIPKNGFTDTTLEESLKYDEYLTKKSDAIMGSKDWRRRVDLLVKSDADDFEIKMRELHMEVPINFLTYSIEDILAKYPDLGSGFSNSLRNYILFGTASFGPAYTVYSSYSGDQYECGVRITDPLTDDDWFWIRRKIDSLLKHKPKNLVNDLESDLKILELSKKKGTDVESSYCIDDEDLAKYSDQNIANEVLPDNLLDEPGRERKNLNLISTRRKRTAKLFQDYFPLFIANRRMSDKD